MRTHSVSRAVISVWTILLVLSVLAASSPVPDPAPDPAPIAMPDPAPEPIDPGLAAVISNNLNLACANGCAAASSAQQVELNANAATVGSAVKPVHLFGAVIIVGALLAAL
ncbi:hypothetical protein EDD16DRAFT_1519572 [Pisolithus croceorrhizus]|nr:hypothetical protein EDD16DRAFT_1519572 [Pisolithus croceorrhizus]